MVDKVLNCRFPRPTASCQLFCFPWAGGGSNFYANWGNMLPESLEVTGLTFPGREGRFKDPCCHSLEVMQKEIIAAILPKCRERPFAFWGHSLGALMCFDVAKTLKSEYNLEPERMFVSGVSAPHSAERKESKVYVKDLNDEEFKDFLKKLGGTPDEILRSEELMALFLPPLRADYELVDQYEYDLEGEAPLTCPIDITDGQYDIKHNLKAWQDLTTGKLTIKMLPGGHFYLKEKDNMMRILENISSYFFE
ncbi:S-acyl fatty acid synthase thioesterase, medium chain-like [Ylistrum balloti]|uniref:S-acyl fatty acid synthase thioesterase, medium chain-like n=1 Tax=Ylistrum balloti TaxID=509963 RepID=UPI0029058CFB|nr:S-acyl fatty acid synthase thioesterase, medium chain-like [Ylistrum balloti]